MVNVLPPPWDVRGRRRHLFKQLNFGQERLNRDGYVVLDQFLSHTECDEMLSASQKFATELPEPQHRTIFSTIGHNQHRDAYFMESNDKIRHFFEEGALDAQGNLTVDPAVALNKVGHALHWHHPVFRCYTYGERVKTACMELEMTDPVVVQSMLIYKNPGTGSEVVAHQDATFLYCEPTPPLGFWIPLEDATVENGCLWVAPGSHLSGVHRRMKRNPDKDSSTLAIFDRPPQIYPESNFIPVPMKKGDCILLHGDVVHKSYANMSDKPRPAYTFHVVERHNNLYSPDNWLQEGPDAPFSNILETGMFV